MSPIDTIRRSLTSSRVPALLTFFDLLEMEKAPDEQVSLGECAGGGSFVQVR